MSWFNALKPESLRDAFIHEVKCAYDMEEQQLKSLVDLEEAATDPELKAMFNRHYLETEQQLQRLVTICGQFGTKAEADTNASARGLVADAKVAVKMGGNDAVRDAVLIMAAQSAEHLEIARYGTLRTWAQILGLNDCVGLLEQSLAEERGFDQQLSDLAEAAVNVEAAR
jgi:ferritin-like metal-binding protein YciE